MNPPGLINVSLSARSHIRNTHSYTQFNFSIVVRGISTSLSGLIYLATVDMFESESACDIFEGSITAIAYRCSYDTGGIFSPWPISVGN
jgi:hypothetical protein